MSKAASLIAYFFKIFSSSATTASPTSLVLALPPRSLVTTPLSMAFLTACSTTSASLGRPREYLSIMAIERMVPTGLTMPFPEMSGAEPEMMHVS